MTRTCTRTTEALEALGIGMMLNLALGLAARAAGVSSPVDVAFSPGLPGMAGGLVAAMIHLSAIKLGDKAEPGELLRTWIEAAFAVVTGGFADLYLSPVLSQGAHALDPITLRAAGFMVGVGAWRTAPAWTTIARGVAGLGPTKLASLAQKVLDALKPTTKPDNPS